MLAIILRWKFVSLLVLLMLSFGCARKSTVVLLPDHEGKVGQITVSNEAGTVDINKAAEATVIKGRGSRPSPPVIFSEKKIASIFSNVLSALPDPPLHFILYFMSGSNDLTDESKKILPNILASIKERESQDIKVVGHADTAGNEQYNIQLSQQRALAVSRLLIAQGVDQAHIASTSHGEGNPLIKTADNVNEPRNRRVEVVVR